MEMSNPEWIINLEKFDNCKRNSFYAKASDITTDVPFIEISNTIIENYLTNHNFIDTRSIPIPAFLPSDHEALEHHAQRIASLIHLIQTGVLLEPVVVYCYDIDDKIARVYGIDDGWHRIRASFYLDKPISFVLETPLLPI